MKPFPEVHRSQAVIIAFASPKGGVGKSTTCAALAGAFAAMNCPVHIIDLDQTRTLHRWFSRFKTNIPSLHVESVAEADFMGHLKDVYATQKGFILIDVAGAFAKAMIQASTVAHLTITPAKLSEPDIIEATKLHREIADLGAAIGKPIQHRLLVNEVSPLFPTYQRAALADIERSRIPRFDTILTERAPYAEIFMTGQTPHFADRTREPVRKAVLELNLLAAEVCALVGPQFQQEAA
jgi:chromosome partitioning protein